MPKKNELFLFIYNGNFRPPFFCFFKLDHGHFRGSGYPWQIGENFCTIPIFRGLSNSKNSSQPSRVNNFQYSRSRRFTERFPRKSVDNIRVNGLSTAYQSERKVLLPVKTKNRVFSAIILYFSVIFLLDERSCLEQFIYQKIKISEGAR